MFLIYMHTSPSNKSYIGYTSHSMEERFAGHILESSRNSQTRFHKALRKYGKDKFESKILQCEIETVEEAKELEKYFIKKYNTFGRDSNGYNMTPGGEGVQLFGDDNGMFGIGHSEETKQKLSEYWKGKRTKEENPWHSSNKTKEELHERAMKVAESRKENGTYSAEFNGMTGNNHSKESKRKMSETKKNKSFITCPHCGLYAKDSSNMTRYHFNNCKSKID